MERSTSAAMFQASGDAYDAFMGRYSQPLAERFADAAGVAAGQQALDVGCGPGALTGVLAARLGAASVAACDPSPPFVAACATRHPGVDVREAPAEALPFEDGRFDVALAQLVLHFVTDPGTSAREMGRVVRPGGMVGACVWDVAESMEMLRSFWDAASAIDRAAPHEGITVRFGQPGEIASLFAAAGFADVEETALDVSATYRDFDDLWNGYRMGVGPVGSYLAALPADGQEALRGELYRLLGAPAGSFTMHATARGAIARVP